MEDVVNAFEITQLLINEVKMAAQATQGNQEQIKEEQRIAKQLEQEKKMQFEKRRKKREEEIEKNIKEIKENRIKFDQIQKSLTKAERENRIAPEGRYTHSPYIE